LQCPCTRSVATWRLICLLTGNSCSSQTSDSIAPKLSDSAMGSTPAWSACDSRRMAFRIRSNRTSSLELSTQYADKQAVNTCRPSPHRRNVGGTFGLWAHLSITS
jgi:hypothetical protein